MKMIAVHRAQSLDETEIGALADLHIACVAEGASVSFRTPLARDTALAYWRDIAAGVTSNTRAVLIAKDGSGICGTSQLVLAQPDNQPHRAELVKLMVATRGRNAGLGRRLLAATEELARECGKSLLVLNTMTGSSAERMYTRAGWKRVGEIPKFAIGPNGELVATTYFYRQL